MARLRSACSASCWAFLYTEHLDTSGPQLCMTTPADVSKLLRLRAMNRVNGGTYSVGSIFVSGEIYHAVDAGKCCVAAASTMRVELLLG